MRSFCPTVLSAEEVFIHPDGGSGPGLLHVQGLGQIVITRIFNGIRWDAPRAIAHDGRPDDVMPRTNENWAQNQVDGNDAQYQSLVHVLRHSHYHLVRRNFAVRRFSAAPSQLHPDDTLVLADKCDWPVFHLHDDCWIRPVALHNCDDSTQVLHSASFCLVPWQQFITSPVDCQHSCICRTISGHFLRQNSA